MHFQWYRQQIYRTDIGAVLAAKARSRAVRTAPWESLKAPKVAFLFLVPDRVEQEDVWSSFFEHADIALFNVYVHQSAPNSSKGSFHDLPNRMVVPFTHSDWCALFGVQVAALVEALRDPENHQFVFVSHNAVPFKSFEYVYQSLVATSLETSKFCFASAQTNRSQSIHTLLDSAHDCRFQDPNRNRGTPVLKHHQWIVLSRRHAEAVVDNAEVALKNYDALREERAGKWQDPKMCSDESVPMLALLELPEAKERQPSKGATPIWQTVQRLGVEQRCTTFTYWPRCMANTSLELPETMQAGLLHPYVFRRTHQSYLQQLVDGPLLFGRKFPRDSAVIMEDGQSQSLHQVLPKMWAKVRTPDVISSMARLEAGKGVNTF